MPRPLPACRPLTRVLPIPARVAVNGWNTEQLGAYVELVRRGRPDFVEVKGVTYCGDSKASPLTIKHCPYHAEVCACT